VKFEKIPSESKTKSVQSKNSSKSDEDC